MVYPQSVPVPTDERAPQSERDDDAPKVLEDVVVTAQKVRQNSRDVPISMSVLDERLLADWGIADLSEAMLFVPNVKVENAGFFLSPRVRGFSLNNLNKAFESPAGLALDGIPYSRAEYFSAALFDVSQIEVLRGPQGTTFGKNTTAGLIHIITRDPDDEFEGVVDVQRGQLGHQRYEAAAGGPLIREAINFRIAALDDRGDGFVRNTSVATYPEAMPEHRGARRRGWRAKLKFPNLFGSDLKLSYESVELQSIGTGMELTHTTELVRQTVRRYDPSADFVRGNYVNSIDSPDQRGTGIDTGTLQWDGHAGDWSLVGLAGHSVLRMNLAVDNDYSPVRAATVEGVDRSPTSTLELRTVSPRILGVDLLLGMFYQRRAIDDSLLRGRFHTGPLLDLNVAAQGGAAADPLAAALELLGLLPPLPTDLAGTTGIDAQHFDQHGSTIAGFGQAEWHLLKHWSLQAGVRLSRETKSAQWNQVFESPPPNLILHAIGLEEFTTDRRIEESHVEPKISVNFRPTRRLGLFLHWARAAKSGGFNAFAYRNQEGELVFRPETSTEWGLDAKVALLGGTAGLNLSLYRMDVRDFQVLNWLPQSAVAGPGVSIVSNAPAARAQGLEGDFTWRPRTWLLALVALGVNDTEYRDFPANACPSDMPNTDGDANARCDATGRPFAFAPKLNGTLALRTTLPWPSLGISVLGGFAAEYASSQLMDFDLDERNRQPAFWRLRASVGVGGLKHGWSLQLVGENLTNEKTYVQEGQLFPGIFVGIQEAPRTLFGQFRWAF